MGFSEFESEFVVHRGVFGLESIGETNEGQSVLDRWRARM